MHSVFNSSVRLKSFGYVNESNVNATVALLAGVSVGSSEKPRAHDGAFARGQRHGAASFLGTEMRNCIGASLDRRRFFAPHSAERIC